MLKVKRIISLFMCMFFILSVFSSVIPVSASSGSDIIMIEKTTTLMDLSNQTYSLGNAGGYSTQKSPKVGDDILRGVMFPIGGQRLNTLTVDKTTFSEPALKYSYKGENQPMNVQLSWKGMTATFVYADFNEKVVVRFSGRTLNNVDGGKPKWELKSPATTLTLSGALKKDTWYNFESTLDLTKTSGNFTVTYTEDTDSNPHTVSATGNVNSTKFTQYAIWSEVGIGENNAVYYDDLKLEYDSVPYEKAKVTSVGSDGVVLSGQNIVPLTLSAKIPKLTKDHIKVTNKETDENVTVDSISVSGDTTQTVNVTLASNLVSWSEYELTIDAAAFGDGAVQRVGSQTATAVTDITSVFETTKPPFAAKIFAFSASGDILNAKALVANTTGTPEDMVFVFTSYNADGSFANIIPTEHFGFNNHTGEYLEANISADGLNKFNFFVIDSWAQRNPLFDAYYKIDNSGNYLPADVLSSGEEIIGSSAAVELGEFDYDNIEISANIDTKENMITTGILFVYKTGGILSSTNLPVYTEVVSTDTTGRALKNIVLPNSLPYDEYTVEFVSSVLDDKLIDTFHYYSPEELLNNKKAAILADAKAASDATELSEILMGVNSAGERVNNNFDIFGQDADMTNYNKNFNKLNVFERMFPSVSALASYDALVTLFDTCATEQRTGEIVAQKNTIVADAKASGTAAKLMKVILGIDDNENIINTNFELISSNADMSVYNTLDNKKAIFSHMVSTIGSVTDFTNLVYRFEQAALTQKNLENTPSRPSSNNSRPGISSTPIRESVSTPTTGTSQQPTVQNSANFSDMSGHWATDYVDALYEKGIMKGYEDGTFKGENSITRAELAKTLVEAFNITGETSKSFSDINNESWYSQYIARASASGIVNGFEDGSFGPDMEVTRQDAVLMLYRAMSVNKKMPIGYKFFVDDLDISDYASDAIRSLGGLGIVTGNTEKKFMPTNSITRAEVATIICRAIDYIESH